MSNGQLIAIEGQGLTTSGMETQTLPSPAAAAPQADPKFQRTEEEFQTIVLEQMSRVSQIHTLAVKHLRTEVEETTRRLAEHKC